jgi:cyclic-di-GMP phosphodiesterase TipF (flagellum assembly factor)
MSGPIGEFRETLEADSGSASLEANVELMQGLIKKLADELGGPTTNQAQAKPAKVSDTEAMIERSVAALEATSRDMRLATEGTARSGLAPAAQPTPGHERLGVVPPAVDPDLERVAEAVAAERMEVLLEPIQALSEGRPRHFEVSTRLIAADGTAINQDDLSRAARISGLMPRIDAARMIRAARVARRLGERGRQGSVLTGVTGESLFDQLFLNAAATRSGTGERMKLVLAFPQSEVRTFVEAHTCALAGLAASGLSFALDEVTDLDMDIGRLPPLGFEFVKLDAQVFLEGLPAPGGLVPAADICRYFADFGLTLIVGRIEDEWLLARVLGFGVLFGTGTLFGGPKPVKAEVLAPVDSAAA